jgi:hypothetical protein
MNDILKYIAIGAAAFFLVLLILAALGKGEALRKWLGPIGGLVVAIIAVIGLSGKGGNKTDDALQKIRAENERIAKENDQLKADAAAAAKKYEADKAAYEAQLADLNTQLTAQVAQRKALEAQLANTATKNPLDWYNSLPPADRKKIDAHIEGKIGEEI